MRIAVCMKHVVDTTEVRVDKKTGKLILSNIPTKINDYDKNAIEEAVRIKEKTGGEVVLLCVGTRDAFKTVKEALAMGCDVGYIITLDGAQKNEIGFIDPQTIAMILSKAIDKLGEFDIILCGEVSEDCYNAQVGPSLAELLDLPHVAYVTKIELKDDTIECESLYEVYENRVEYIEVPMPAVLTVTRLINTPRLPTLLQVMKVPKNKIIFWDLDELGISAEDAAGLVNVTGYSEMKTERKRVIIEDPPEEAVKKLVEILKEEGVV